MHSSCPLGIGMGGTCSKDGIENANASVSGHRSRAELD